MNKISCIVIDDEELARGLLRSELVQFSELEILAECANGFEALKAIQELQPQLIFLDIQMPKISGFELLELLENRPHVVFITAFEEHALKAFEVNAVDYILKPFGAERLRMAVEKCITKIRMEEKPELWEIKELPHEKERIVVKSGNQIKILPVPKIEFIESWDDYVKLFFEGHFYSKKKTMNHYELLLNEAGFVRIHRKYLVNLLEITSIKNLTPDTFLVYTRNGAELSCSRAGYQKLKSRLQL